jgi:uncharacterized oligopeptide transporter (OPT) family protein
LSRDDASPLALTGGQIDALMTEWLRLVQLRQLAFSPWPAGTAALTVMVTRAGHSDPTARTTVRDAGGWLCAVLGWYERAWEAMSPAEYQVVRRRLWDGQTWHKVAAGLGISRHTAGRLLERARRVFVRVVPVWVLAAVRAQMIGWPSDDGAGDDEIRRTGDW